MAASHRLAGIVTSSGALVFVQGFEAGVIPLRVEPATFHVVHEKLAQVLESYTFGAVTIFVHDPVPTARILYL